MWWKCPPLALCKVRASTVETWFWVAYDSPAPPQCIFYSGRHAKSPECFLWAGTHSWTVSCKHLVRVTARHFGASFGNPLPSLPSSLGNFQLLPAKTPASPEICRPSFWRRATALAWVPFGASPKWPPCSPYPLLRLYTYCLNVRLCC